MKDNMPPPQIQRPQITPDMLKNAKTIECECGGMIFNNGLVIKKISMILSPTGEDMEIPIQVIYCADCGKVLPDTDKDGVLPNKIKSSPITKSIKIKK